MFILGSFMRELIFTKHICKRCKKPFEAPGTPVPGMYCKECTALLKKVGEIERTLIRQEFSIEQEDIKIAKQINDVLVKEDSGASYKDEELLNELTERLLEDAKKRKRILKEIKSLQKKKR